MEQREILEKLKSGTLRDMIVDLWVALDKERISTIKLQKDLDAAIDEEQKRWCENLDFLHTEYGADCSGCDSGDPLDCVEVEIRQAIETAKQQAVMQCYQIASSHEFGPDAAKTIRETFGLEI